MDVLFIQIHSNYKLQTNSISKINNSPDTVNQPTRILSSTDHSEEQLAYKFNFSFMYWKRL